MKFENEELGVSFVLPDRPTVRQVLSYDAAVEFNREALAWERWWMGLCKVAQEWQCEKVALSEDVLDGTSDPQVVQVVKWAGLSGWAHFWALKDIPKN